MRAVFGVLSLLVVLAIVATLVTKQMKAMKVTTGAVAGSPADASSATVREQSQQMQKKVADDITKALEQGAARNDQAEK
jgi:uncharacterized membrane protein